MFRYRPRVNPEVNDHWLCDYGRFSYERYETDRVVVPKVRTEDDYLGISTWIEALEAIANAAATSKNSVVIASANMTNEEAALAVELSKRLGASIDVMVDPIGPIKMKSRTEWLLGTQAAPNYRGVRAAIDGKPATVPPYDPESGAPAGVRSQSIETLMTQGAGGVDFLYVCDAMFSERASDPAIVANLRKAKFLVVHSWDANHPLCDAADVLIPSTTHVEKEGTFTNLQGRQQQIVRAYAPKGQTVGDDEVFRRVIHELSESGAPAAARG